MKYKVFSAESSKRLEQLVNEWAATQTAPIRVQHSDTKITSVVAGRRSVPVISLAIWYDIAKPPRVRTQQGAD